MSRTPSSMPTEKGLIVCLVGFPGSLTRDVTQLPAGDAAARILDHIRSLKK